MYKINTICSTTTPLNNIINRMDVKAKSFNIISTVDIHH